MISQGAAGDDQHGDGGVHEEEEVDHKEALFGDPIIGEAEQLEDENGPGARPANILPAPKEMTLAEWISHCVTHLPYHPGCPICAATRRPNSHHRLSHENARVVPLLVGDYCFVKSSTDDANITVLVLKLYPYKLFLHV